MQIFTVIYVVKGKFWDIWNVTKTEYFEAVYLENALFERKNVDFKEYADLADKKSAFSKTAIDGLHILSKSKNELEYKKLLIAHGFFFVALQLFDDIKDLNKI